MRLRSGWREDVEVPVEGQGVVLKLVGDLSRLPIRLFCRAAGTLGSVSRFDWRKAGESLSLMNFLQSPFLFCEAGWRGSSQPGLSTGMPISNTYLNVQCLR